MNENKTEIQLCAAYRRLISAQRLKVKRQKRIFHASENKRKVRVLISEKIDFKPKTITEGKEYSFVF